MKITYDRKVDALNVSLCSGEEPRGRPLRLRADPGALDLGFSQPTIDTIQQDSGLPIAIAGGIIGTLSIKGVYIDEYDIAQAKKRIAHDGIAPDKILRMHARSDEWTGDPAYFIAAAELTLLPLLREAASEIVEKFAGSDLTKEMQEAEVRSQGRFRRWDLLVRLAHYLQERKADVYTLVAAHKYLELSD